MALSIPVWYCVAVKLKKKKNNYLKIIFLYFIFFKYFNIKNNFLKIKKLLF